MTQSENARLPEQAADVLDFWLGEADEDPRVAAGRNAMWFGASSEVDAEIDSRFLDTVCNARAGRCKNWLKSPRGVSALIIVLDQFPRNLFRGSAEAFASDRRALELSLVLQHEGQLDALGWMSRVFALMPMQHAEDLSVQQRSVAAFASLAANCDEGFREQLENNAGFARLHHDIIARFGRFPHRNRILGRASSDEEDAWLEAGAPTFGQG